MEAWNTALWTRERSVAARGINAIAFHPSGDRLITGDWDGRITIREGRSLEPLLSFEAHRKKITDLAFVSDGDRLVSSSADGTLKVWSVRPPLQ